MKSTLLYTILVVCIALGGCRRGQSRKSALVYNRATLKTIWIAISNFDSANGRLPESLAELGPEFQKERAKFKVREGIFRDWLYLPGINSTRGKVLVLAPTPEAESPTDFLALFADGSVDFIQKQ